MAEGVLKLMGSTPRKFFYTFSQEGDQWKCTNNAGEVAVKKSVPIVAKAKVVVAETKDDDAFDPLDMM